jgi:energy-coupling factor transport system ATP-binding protein
LQNIHLQIDAGEFVLLVGPSGAGKSTLLRLFNGLAPHFTGGRLSGQVRVHGLDPVQATPRLMSRHVGFVFQDPEAQFVMDRVEDELAFGLEQAALTPQAMRIRVEETLALLDLTPLRDRPLATLSGGERQRVAIGAALALRPAILVLDEPTSQLDPQAAEDLLTALVRLNSDLGLTIVLAEHRLERVLPFVDRLLYLAADGATLLTGEPRTLLPQIDLAPPLVQVAKTLGWEPLPLTIKEGLRFSRYHPTPVIPPGGPPIQPTPPAVRKPVAEIKGVTVAYGVQPVLQGIELKLYGGEIVALMGRNGAGKSTLLKSLVGLVQPRQGIIELQGRAIAGHSVATLCRAVGYLPQDPNSLLFAESVRDEVVMTLHNHGLAADPHQADAAITPLLATLGLTSKATHYPRDLSAGERQRVALAASLVTQPALLLLDEPTRGLDYLAKAALIDLLRTLARQGKAILVVTHDVELAAALADRVVLLSQGEVIADGAPTTLLAASPLFASQVARLFPNSGWRTVDDVLQHEGRPKVEIHL